MKLSGRVNLRCWTDGEASVLHTNAFHFYTGDALNQFWLEKAVACIAPVTFFFFFNGSIAMLTIL